MESIRKGKWIAEYVFEENIQKLNERGHYVEEQDKLIQQMSHKIQLLQSEILNLKVCFLQTISISII